jgi:hypothetical protein
MPRVWVPRHVARLVTRLVAPLVVDYSASRRLVVDYSASRRLVVDYFTSAARSAASARRGGSSRGSSRRSSSTTPSRTGSSLTTSPLPRVRVPRHVVRLVTQLVVPLVVDYSASRRLVVDYFASAAHPGASARCAACHAARRAARCRLLCLAQAAPPPAGSSSQLCLA